jgi:hypothetical protein
MYFDITTPESRLRAKKAYGRYLYEVLNAAIDIHHRLDETDKNFALKTVVAINRIRYQIYEKAMELGYVKNCIHAISLCKGECCKWHFPQKLELTDLFITVCDSGSKELGTLKDQLISDNGKYQCPLLRENGCLLPFDTRPLSCSNAYPCFSGELYNRYLKKKEKHINAQRVLLYEIFQKWTRGRNCDTGTLTSGSTQ